MANQIRCRYCQSQDVFQSRFRWIDLICIPFGFPCRCLQCHERFHTWKEVPKRSPLPIPAQSKLQFLLSDLEHRFD